jgi:DMSO/TMAO reductase YedYZ heme-binding membrane subunit
MAVAKNSRLTVSAASRATSRPRAPRVSARVLFAVGAVGLFGAAATLTSPGAVAMFDLHWFLEYFSGVFSLVSLSVAVMIGLAATDRLILLIRHRVLLQAVHRAMAMTSMLFLGIHILLKVLESHARPIDAVVPFIAQGNRSVFMGLGTIACYLMIIVTWTGVIRGRFAGSAHPGLWRALHATAYVAWPLATVHGLVAGRQAKTWVTVSYIVCAILVTVGLLVRVFVTWSRRLHAPKATTTGAIKPVGKMVPSSRPVPVIPMIDADSVRPSRWDDEQEPISSIPVSPYPAGARSMDRAPAGARSMQQAPVGARRDEPGESWAPRGPQPDEWAAIGMRAADRRPAAPRRHEWLREERDGRERDGRERDGREDWAREQLARAREEVAREEWESGTRAEREAGATGSRSAQSRTGSSTTAARHASPTGDLPRRSRLADDEVPAITDARRRPASDTAETGTRAGIRHSAPPNSAPPAPYSAPPRYRETEDLGTGRRRVTRDATPEPRRTRRLPEDAPPPPRTSRRRRPAEPPSRAQPEPRLRRSTQDISDEDFWAYMRGEALR